MIRLESCHTTPKLNDDTDLSKRQHILPSDLFFKGQIYIQSASDQSGAKLTELSVFELLL